MKKQNNSASPLFNIQASKKQDDVVENKPIKKRGRPPKQKVVVETVTEQQESKHTKELNYDQLRKQSKKLNNSNKKKEDIQKQEKVKSNRTALGENKSDGPDVGWKDFVHNRPDVLKPLEFYVDTGKEKRDIFRGYISIDGSTATDEPYKLTVIRRKYNNLYYREIKGCDLSQCPNNFPSCENCKNKKQRLI